MELSVCKQINVYDFVYSLISILKKKGINEINVDELKYSLNYFSLFDKYQYLFSNINPLFELENIIDALYIAGYIFRFNSNKNIIYLIKDKENENDLNNEFNLIVNQLADEVILLMNSKKQIDDIEVINPNMKNYQIISGLYGDEIIKWDLITDGDINIIYDINHKGYFHDFRNKNVILILNEVFAKKIILENATFAIKQGRIDDVIFKNILYAECLNEEKFNKISNYFDQIEIEDSKVKRISL
ncbi:MAG: hypothetical protein E7157_03270 [Lactobacillales bacterium]|nr:hypothetical protein [Lactobacillales bacterium]